MSQEPREKMGQDRLAEGKENKPAGRAFEEAQSSFGGPMVHCR